jgi:hypoxanthine phosphoribosyltransferase
VVDDLLDSGLTFETIYSNLQLENILYIFYYDKQNYSPNCKKILTKLKKDGKLIIGKKQKPENWLCFWYDFQEL